MSGLTRSNSSASRRTARRHTALPYSRPAPKKSVRHAVVLFAEFNADPRVNSRGHGLMSSKC